MFTTWAQLDEFLGNTGEWVKEAALFSDNPKLWIGELLIDAIAACQIALNSTKRIDPYGNITLYIDGTVKIQIRAAK